jgi:hypothetical protein
MERLLLSQNSHRPACASQLRGADLPSLLRFRGEKEVGPGTTEQNDFATACIHPHMIRKLKSGEYRLYSRKKDESTGKRRNLGTFSTMEKAKQHEREVQYFKKH